MAPHALAPEMRRHTLAPVTPASVHERLAVSLDHFDPSHQRKNPHRARWPVCGGFRSLGPRRPLLELSPRQPRQIKNGHPLPSPARVTAAISRAGQTGGYLTCLGSAGGVGSRTRGRGRYHVPSSRLAVTDTHGLQRQRAPAVESHPPRTSPDFRRGDATSHPRICLGAASQSPRVSSADDLRMGTRGLPSGCVLRMLRHFDLGVLRPLDSARFSLPHVRAVARLPLPAGGYPLRAAVRSRCGRPRARLRGSAKTVITSREGCVGEVNPGFSRGVDESGRSSPVRVSRPTGPTPN
jgi:hypothetical protein